MPSFITPQNGDDAVAEHVAQLTEDFQGLRNIPISLTGINDAANYALNIKNVGAGGKDVMVLAPDGVTVLFSIDSTGVKASPDGVAGASGFATLTGVQTLTNKTLTSPILTTPTADAYIATGLTGSVAASRYVGATASGAPTTGAHLVGDFAIDQTGKMWVCTVAGTPGTWLQAGGALTTASNALGADVLLNNTANFFDGPSMAQGTSGTWFCSGSVCVTDTSAIAPFTVKLWDGTTVIAEAVGESRGASSSLQFHLSGLITSPAGNVRISVKDSQSVNGKIMFNVAGNSKSAAISGLRIA